MNALEARLNEVNQGLLDRLSLTKKEVSALLTKYDSNFPKYTDHSISHTSEVFDLAANLLTPAEVLNLTGDEIYILAMGCYLHDIGMCIPEERIVEIEGTENFLKFKETSPGITVEEFVREIHHELSYKLIMQEWELLQIPDIKYAKAIGLVAQGHRKVDLNNVEEYKTKFFVRSGREFVCLPYLASVLRIADELDITNVRTPALLHKYYLPNSDVSRLEWKKHIATTQINFAEDYVLFEVKCTDQNMLAALETQFEKVEKTLQYCQKVIRTIGNTEDRRFRLNLMRVIPKFEFEGFDPKGIKFSFDVQNVTRTFIGEDLYDDYLTAIREAVQNSIDSCLYRVSLGDSNYVPFVGLEVSDEEIAIKDNGLGMDEFVIENFFGRLGSSFYEQPSVKNKFDAIGQFGVGVFSYFLISDYVDIKTKTEHGASLYFRINDDPKSYFHFFDMPDQIDQGTSVHLHLNKSYKGRITFAELEKYLRKYFRFIDLTIELREKDAKTTINKNSFGINEAQELQTRLRIQFADKADNFEIIRSEIMNENFAGECGLLIKRIGEKFDFKSLMEVFDDDAFEVIKYGGNYSEVALSQKGVYINSYSGGLLRYMIGNINLFQKERININRQEFTHTDRIMPIINHFEIKLIENVFSRLRSVKRPQVVARLTNEFLTNYLDFYSYYQYDMNELRRVIGENLFLAVYDNGVVKYLPFAEMKKYDSFLQIVRVEKHVKIFEKFGIPIVLSTGGPYRGSFGTIRKLLIHLFDFEPTIAVNGAKGYQKYVPDSSKYIQRLREAERISEFSLEADVEVCDHGFLMSSIWDMKPELGQQRRDGNFSFNPRHPFIAELIGKAKEIRESEGLRRITKSILMLIRGTYFLRGKGFSQKRKEQIESINQIAEGLKAVGISREFAEQDFW